MEPDHMLLNYTVPAVQSFTIQCKRLKCKTTILTMSTSYDRYRKEAFDYLKKFRNYLMDGVNISWVWGMSRHSLGTERRKEYFSQSKEYVKVGG